MLKCGRPVARAVATAASLLVVLATLPRATRALDPLDHSSQLLHDAVEGLVGQLQSSGKRESPEVLQSVDEWVAVKDRMTREVDGTARYKLVSTFHRVLKQKHKRVFAAHQKKMMSDPRLRYHGEIPQLARMLNKQNLRAAHLNSGGVDDGDTVPPEWDESVMGPQRSAPDNTMRRASLDDAVNKPDAGRRQQELQEAVHPSLGRADYRPGDGPADTDPITSSRVDMARGGAAASDTEIEGAAAEVRRRRQATASANTGGGDGKSAGSSGAMEGMVNGRVKLDRHPDAPEPTPPRRAPKPVDNWRYADEEDDDAGGAEEALATTTTGTDDGRDEL